MPTLRALVPTLALALLALLGAACAGAISPRTVRDELVRQSGQPPTSELELKLGRLITTLAHAVAPEEELPLPLQGLRRLEIAHYGVAPGSAPLDPSPIAPWGWDPTVRWRGPRSSALVLVRPAREDRPIADLVLVAGDTERVVYARLGGRLARTLPEALRRAVEDRGPDSVRQSLVDAAGGTEQ